MRDGFCVASNISKGAVVFWFRTLGSGTNNPHREPLNTSELIKIGPNGPLTLISSSNQTRILALN